MSTHLYASADWTREISDALDRAKHHVEIATFTIKATSAAVPEDRPDLYRAIERAAKRGVDVRLIRSIAQRLEGVRQPAMRASYRLSIAGARVRVHTGPTLLHAKGILIDSWLLSVGSHNVTRTSSASNIELSIITTERPACAQFWAWFGELWNTAHDDSYPQTLRPWLASKT